MVRPAHFITISPATEYRSQGARSGSLLFQGKSIDGRYVGTAYIFNSGCGRFPYQVSGPILDNYERVVLQGQAPRIAANCRIQGYLADTLEFTLLKSGATAPSDTRDSAIHSQETQIDLAGIIGKWSDSDDRKTCEIPVGSDPDPATTYQFTPKYFVYYEIECLVQDVANRTDGLVLNIDCLKAGGAARWFEKLTVRRLTRARLSFRFWDRKPGFPGPTSTNP